MCSLIGMSSPRDVKASVKEIKTLFMFAEERGGHGCGLYHNKTLNKTAEDAPNFIKHITEPLGTFIGHTRYKTSGVKKSDNSHPFVFSTVVGAHNGTIYNYDELKKKEKLDYEVDSQGVYHLINKYGLKKTLPMLVGKVGLSYEDSYGNINLYRFDRPLHIGNKGDKLFWASLPGMLTGIGCENVREIPEHTHYVIKDGKITSSCLLKNKYKPTKHVQVNQTQTNVNKLTVNGKTFYWYLNFVHNFDSIQLSLNITPPNISTFYYKKDLFGAGIFSELRKQYGSELTKEIVNSLEKIN